GGNRPAAGTAGGGNAGGGNAGGGNAGGGNAGGGNVQAPAPRRRRPHPHPAGVTRPPHRRPPQSGIRRRRTAGRDGESEEDPEDTPPGEGTTPGDGTGGETGGDRRRFRGFNADLDSPAVGAAIPDRIAAPPTCADLTNREVRSRWGELCDATV
ncbi:hypothetical protein GS436_20885, partial [Rhodococcus hoagii]|nr:hypothetical protein [Prescottella equi]